MAQATGAAIFGQKRGVDVETSEARNPEEFGRQNLAIGGDDDHVGRISGDRLVEIGPANLFRLENRQSFALRQFLDRRRANLLASARRSVGLCHNADDLVGGLAKPVERRNGKIGRSHENDLHHSTFFFALAPCIRIILRSEFDSRGRIDHPHQ
jgi:hypothetical protein